jgi:AcrR family transcriptional regulator
MAEQQIGRPRASSREVLAEAACELFLERGYEATSVADITTRAGVSRSSFFNYFGSKGDVLWAGLDERIASFCGALEGAESDAAPAAVAVRSALLVLGDGFAPDSLALAFAHAGAMGIGSELEREAAVRRSRISAAVGARLRADGAAAIAADVAGAAHGGAVLAAIEAWAHDGAGRAPLAARLREAVDAASLTLPGPVRQLRLVVRAEDFEEALMFYRDDLGLTPQESYEGDGGARVAILAAGRATLELSNPAQVTLIDRVETDGDAPSDRLRVAFEVAHTADTVERLTDAGAAVEASARVTPWRSVNARLRAPAGLQLTIFQELGL